MTLWDELLRQVAPDFAGLLQSLSDEQVEDLFENLAEENQELEEDYSGISREERRAKQDKAIIKAFRRFTGTPEPRAGTAGAHAHVPAARPVGRLAEAPGGLAGRSFAC